MTIQKIAQKQLDQSSTLYFARRGTADCLWFELGQVMAYNHAGSHTRVYLGADELAATDWRVITPSK